MTKETRNARIALLGGIFAVCAYLLLHWWFWSNGSVLTKSTKANLTVVVSKRPFSTSFFDMFLDDTAIPVRVAA